MIPIFLVTFVLAYIFYHLKQWWNRFNRWNDFSGPSKYASFPIVGHAYKMAGRKMYEVMRENRKKYGDIYRFDIGNLETVYLCDYEDIRQAFNSDAFGGRSFDMLPGYVHTRIRDKDGDLAGIATMESNNPKLLEYKKFTKSVLSEVGVGKSNMEDIILEEVLYTCDIFMEKAKCNGGKVPITGLFGPAINNATWRVVSGRQSKQSDPHLIELVRAVRKLFAFCQTDELFKALQFNSLSFCKMCNWLGVKDNLISLTSSVQKVLWKDAEEGVSDSLGSFIDRHYFMQEKNKYNSQSIFHKEYSMGQLKGALWDLFLGGTDSTSTFLEWCILFLIKYPGVQVKLYEETMKNIGNRTATLSDRPNLAHFESFVEEVSRICHQGDISVPHRVTKDTTFKGYFFPKDTQVFTDLDAVYHDPNYWKDPETFMPERFLSADGKYKPDPRMSFFGIGKRKCIGENLARGSILLFLVGLVQRFEFVQTGNPSLEPIPGLVTCPRPFEAIVIPRF